jgi:hypothetical protein
MRARRSTVAALWAIAAFVSWHVAFDDGVADGATAFTREQIRRRQQGLPTVSIDEGFSPSVARAARTASYWGGVVLGVGLIVVWRMPGEPGGGDGSA